MLYGWPRIYVSTLPAFESRMKKEIASVGSTWTFYICPNRTPPSPDFTMFEIVCRL